MAKTRTYRTLDEVDEEYYRSHPEEIYDYLSAVFDEYSKDNDMAALLSSLRMIVRVKGVSDIAEISGITRNGIQKSLKEESKPGFETISAILRALGYGFGIRKFEPQQKEEAA